MVRAAVLPGGLLRRQARDRLARGDEPVLLVVRVSSCESRMDLSVGGAGGGVWAAGAAATVTSKKADRRVFMIPPYRSSVVSDTAGGRLSFGAPGSFVRQKLSTSPSTTLAASEPSLSFSALNSVTTTPTQAGEARKTLSAAKAAVRSRPPGWWTSAAERLVTSTSKWRRNMSGPSLQVRQRVPSGGGGIRADAREGYFAMRECSRTSSSGGSKEPDSSS